MSDNKDDDWFKAFGTEEPKPEPRHPPPPTTSSATSRTQSSRKMAAFFAIVVALLAAWTVQPQLLRPPIAWASSLFQGRQSQTSNIPYNAGLYLPPPEAADRDAPVYDPDEKSNTMGCAKGSTSVGIHTGYVRGVPRQLRLCALPITAVGGEESIPGSRYYIRGADKRPLVSAPVSYNWMKLIRAAKIRGITLTTTSSFRTMQHQQELWDASDKTGRAVARAGYSNHQQGAAIDFAFDVGISTSLCKWRVRNGVRLCTMAGDRTYEWLHAQAHKYGLSQYYAEYWHFSPDGH